MPSLPTFSVIVKSRGYCIIRSSWCSAFATVLPYMYARKVLQSSKTFSTLHSMQSLYLLLQTLFVEWLVLDDRPTMPRYGYLWGLTSGRRLSPFTWRTELYVCMCLDRWLLTNWTHMVQSDAYIAAAPRHNHACLYVWLSWLPQHHVEGPPC